MNPEHEQRLIVFLDTPNGNNIMRLLLIYLIALKYLSQATIVIDVKSSTDEKIVVSLGREVEIGIPLTVCIRFNLKGKLSSRYIFSGSDGMQAVSMVTVVEFQRVSGKIH